MVPSEEIIHKERLHAIQKYGRVPAIANASPGREPAQRKERQDGVQSSRSSDDDIWYDPRTGLESHLSGTPRGNIVCCGLLCLEPDVITCRSLVSVSISRASMDWEHISLRRRYSAPGIAQRTTGTAESLGIHAFLIRPAVGLNTWGNNIFLSAPRNDSSIREVACASDAGDERSFRR